MGPLLVELIDGHLKRGEALLQFVIPLVQLGDYLSLLVDRLGPPLGFLAEFLNRLLLLVNRFGLLLSLIR